MVGDGLVVAVLVGVALGLRVGVGVLDGLGDDSGLGVAEAGGVASCAVAPTDRRDGQGARGVVGRAGHDRVDAPPGQRDGRAGGQ